MLFKNISNYKNLIGSSSLDVQNSVHGNDDLDTVFLSHRSPLVISGSLLPWKRLYVGRLQMTDGRILTARRRFGSRFGIRASLPTESSKGPGLAGEEAWPRRPIERSPLLMGSDMTHCG